jgi:hypothetical protein
LPKLAMTLTPTMTATFNATPAAAGRKTTMAVGTVSRIAPRRSRSITTPLLAIPPISAPLPRLGVRRVGVVVSAAADSAAGVRIE